MKVIHEFDSATDAHEIWLANNATQFWLALCELAKQTREWQKYDPRTDIPATEVRDTFVRIIMEHNLNLDNLC